MKIYVCHISAITAVSQCSKKGFFTVLLKGNINARSNFVSSRYHGTSISIIQFVSEDNTGLDFPEVDISQDVSLKSKRLLSMLRNCLQRRVALKASYGHFCSINVSIGNDSELRLIDDALTNELQWLCVVVAALDDKKLIIPGWSRCHASFKRKPIDPSGMNTIFPLLLIDKVHSLNMQAHCMLLNINSVKVLNEGQTQLIRHTLHCIGQKIYKQSVV